MSNWVFYVALIGAWCGGYGFGKRRGIKQAKRHATERWWPFADKGVGR